MRFADVLVTCPDRATAARLARVAVEGRLAACANFGPIESVYRWQGKVEEAAEVALCLKTRLDMFDRLSAAIRANHPYEVPCIVATEMVAVDPAFAAWLADATGTPDASPPPNQ